MDLKGMFDKQQSMDFTDEDLEDELNAILAGGNTGGKMTQQKGGSVNPNVAQRQDKLPATQQMKGKSKTTGKRPANADLDLGIDLSQIGNLTLDEDFDVDDDDLDEDNEDLLAEINEISTQPSPIKKSRSPVPSIPTIPSIPPPDYFMDQNQTSQLHADEASSMKKQNEPQMNTQRASANLVHKDDSHQQPSLVGQPRVEQQTLKELTPNKDVNSNKMTRLTSLRDEYRRAALSAKKNNDQATALSHIKVSKQIEVLIKALESGQEVDLNELPGHPSDSSSSSQLPKAKVEQQQPVAASNEEVIIPAEFQMNEEEAEKIFGAPPPPKSIVEALEQRISKFKSTLEQAKSENNSSKVRRLGRIVKSYEAAIKHHKAGMPVDFDELPVPPGFGPIPTDIGKNEPQATKPANIAKPNVAQTSESKSIPTSSGATNLPNRQVASQELPKKQAPPPPPPKLKRATSTSSKQMNYLIERQAMFKEAALESKKKGDLQQAKEYLKMAKGFDPLIEATRNGLPIDATSIPTPPQISDDFVLVSQPEASGNVDDLEREEIYRKIEIELHNQIEMCKRNKEYFLQLGDVSTASKFEKYAADSKKDCDMLIVRWRNGEKVPTFKYETRSFSVVICNTEVGTNELDRKSVV